MGLSEMALNSGLMLLVLLFGILVVCSVPYGASHICGGDANCVANLPRIMVATCTVCSFLGRFIATLIGKDRDIKNIGVSVVFRAFFTGGLTWAYTTGQFPPGLTGQALVVAAIATVTIWGNILTIDLSRESQRACGHSLLFPCPVTAQITWISLQSASLLGSLCSFF